MASSGPQEANGHPGAREKDVGGRWYVSHRWRRSAYVTCLVFVPCSKFLQKASADNCSIQECFVLVACCSFCFCSCSSFLVSVGFCSCCCFLRQLSARLLGCPAACLTSFVNAPLSAPRHTHTHITHTLTAVPVVILFSFVFTQFSIFYFSCLLFSLFLRLLPLLTTAAKCQL